MSKDVISMARDLMDTSKLDSLETSLKHSFLTKQSDNRFNYDLFSSSMNGMLCVKYFKIWLCLHNTDEILENVANFILKTGNDFINASLVSK